MSNCGQIKLRPLTDLLSDSGSAEQMISEPIVIVEPQETPQNFRKKKRAATTSKKKVQNEAGTSKKTTKTTLNAATEVKKTRSGRKDPLPGQLRINSFFQSAVKDYTIPKCIEKNGSNSKKCVVNSVKKPKRRRKALFRDDESTTTTTTSISDNKSYTIKTRNKSLKKTECFIDLCSESDAEENMAQKGNSKVRRSSTLKTIEEGNGTSDDPRTLVPIENAMMSTPKEIDKIKEELQDSLRIVERNNNALPTYKRASLEPIEKIEAVEIKKTPETPQKPKKVKESPSKGNKLNVWLEKSCNKSPKKESKDTNLSETKKSIKTRSHRLSLSFNKANKRDIVRGEVLKGQEMVAIPRNTRLQCSKTDELSKKLFVDTKTELAEEVMPKNTRQRKKKKVLPTEIETACPKNKKNKLDILSPSDSKVYSHEKRPTTRAKVNSKNSFNENKPEETKFATPPNSKSDSPTFLTDVLLECSSYSNDIVTISDEEFENEQITKPTKKSKRKSDGTLKSMITPKTETKKRIKKQHPCPPYKVIEGTTFAVDAFRYGEIKGVTHYFLSHFHADHYIGLNRKFSYPLYTSPITARLLDVFIPIDEEFMRIISINEPIEINEVEVTAIDANHCPGAVMFVFKTRTGRCTLHCGDFRACPEMESEPIFWNNDIHTIYLDTTYFPKKYAFCSQSDSIKSALHIIEEFREKNVGTRVLYVCGSYLVGKERFWSTIAHKLSFKVWTNGPRRQAQQAINDENILSLLVDDPCDANMHVIPMVHLNYSTLVEYIDKYSKKFDILFALRPSGWEKNSKPQFRGKVNIVGIEYSEHSSHDELKRFVQYLKPTKVISTVPVGRDSKKTAKIPDNWYKYNTLTGKQHKFQPAITSYFKLNGGNVATPNETPEVKQKRTKFSKPSDAVNKMIISPLQENEKEILANGQFENKGEDMNEENKQQILGREEVLAEGHYKNNEEDVNEENKKQILDADEEEDDWLT